MSVRERGVSGCVFLVLIMVIVRKGRNGID